MHSRFIENPLIDLVEINPLISDVVLSQCGCRLDVVRWCWSASDQEVERNMMWRG
jgi:hypothetical protein